MISDKLFLDSDILLDLFFDRKPFSQFSEKLFDIDLKGKFTLYTSSLVVANLHYIISRQHDKNFAKNCLKVILKHIVILPLKSEAIEHALNGDYKDFEDCVQYFIAVQNECTAILSRNLKDYKNSSIPVLTAESYFKR